MTFDKIYPLVRSVLGDEQVHGIWYYADDRIDSAIKAIFLFGLGPEGYALNDAQNAIEPDLKTGDPYALLSYEASKLLIGGEDGAQRITTRALSVSDEGHRKRDLLIELRQQIYLIRDGGSIFTTYQHLEEFLNTTREGLPYPLQFSEATVATQAPDIVL